MQNDPMIRIRRYLPSDRAAIESVHDEARKIELKYACAVKEHLFDHDGIFVAEINGTVIGFTACTEDELSWLYVSPAHMRKGIGRALVHYALCRFPDINHIEVLKGNEPAKALYESFGFKVLKCARGKMPGNEKYNIEVYIMHKPTDVF